jgi:2'-5' RNA ligase
VTRAADPPSRLRVFVALDLDPLLRERMGGLADGLRAAIPGLRFMRSESLHLTLRFYGLCSANQVETLRSRLGAAAASAPVTDAAVQGLGLFPERGKPRVLFLSLAVGPPVRTLQAACEAAAIEAGLAAESRPFVAHVTLGRWREPVARPSLPPVDLGRVRLDTLTLYRSDLHPSGAVHVPLGRFALAG